jgi:hypothetical protein
MGDDGEKFGGWPTTYAHCWEKGWVDRFLDAVEADAEVETVHLGVWRQERPPVSLAYLPAMAYMEMGEWALPPAQQRAIEEAKAILRGAGREDLVGLVRGGHWRNFLVRYPEVNLLHKRLLALSCEAHRQDHTAALDHVWQAQCNCPFWHGVFGGVYLEHIRHANFGHMAAADALLYPGAREPEVADWDYDGRDEVCLRSPEHLVIIAPSRGGEVQHWELRNESWHLTHAVARRPEAYHERLANASDEGVRSIHDTIQVKDPEAAEAALIYDRGMRLAAQDTLVGGEAERAAYSGVRLSAPAAAAAWSADGQGASLTCATEAGTYTKAVTVSKRLEVEYRVPGGTGLFSEWNLSLPEDERDGGLTVEMAPGLLRVQAGMGLTLEARHTFDEVWHERLFSASNTEGGVELAPQGWSFVFRASQPAGAARQLTIAWARG